jgi:xylulokinase
MKYILGIDIGSSSVKASLLEIDSGQSAGSAFFPPTEMGIQAPQAGFAEQYPQDWYSNAKNAVKGAIQAANANADEIAAIGIAYQMHGLVCIDKTKKVLRPAIIWCDSRAVDYGAKAFEAIGPDKSLDHLMNSPGNFTAAKLAWVKQNQPEIFAETDKIMLPGDWLAMRLTGETATTVSGLSEGIFWDFKDEQPSRFLLDYFGFEPTLLPDIVPTFGIQGQLTSAAATDFGLAAGTPVAYRAGDQPNNALSLNVFEPGEIAATAGTSGVVYGVSDQKRYDPQQRVNTFAHVNHSKENPRLGILLCINGTGILNSWTSKLLGNMPYSEMDSMAANVPAGSDGITVLPFGNGSERLLGNRSIGAQFAGLDFNRHNQAHICRAVQEGIVFSFQYGLEAMRETGITTKTIRAGFANMFMSDIFRQTLADISGADIELFDTDGSLGAARGAGIGAGIYKSPAEAFQSLTKKKTVVSQANPACRAAYQKWKEHLNKVI